MALVPPFQGHVACRNLPLTGPLFSEIDDQELDVFVKSILELLRIVAIFDHAKARSLRPSIYDFEI